MLNRSQMTCWLCEQLQYKLLDCSAAKLPDLLVEDLHGEQKVLTGPSVQLRCKFTTAVHCARPLKLESSVTTKTMTYVQLLLYNCVQPNYFGCLQGHSCTLG
jgi:hypothetical protein